MQTNVQSMATVQSGSGERTKHLRNLIDRRIKRGGFSWQACKNINVPANRNNPDLNKESEYSLTLYSRRLSDHINILAKAGFAVERVIEETDRKTLDNDYAFSSRFYSPYKAQ